MLTRLSRRLTKATSLTCGLWCAIGLATSLSAAEDLLPAEPPAQEPVELTPAPPAPTLSTQDFSALVQIAVEQARLQAEAAARANADTLAARLREIEQTFREQREQDLAAAHRTNRALLVTIGVFAGAGVLGMLVMAWVQVRAMRQFSEAVSTLPGAHALGFAPGAAALAAGETRLVPAGAAEQSGAKFLSAVERLERRIRELEHSTTPLAEEISADEANGDPGVRTGDPALKSLVSGALSRAAGEHHETGAQARPGAMAGATSPEAQGAQESDVSLLLGKGQALLNLDQALEALACFDQAVALEPDNAEALIKKGTALERLRRFDEAVECFDRAIALDGAQTTAYLHKGAVCNRLARYSEALACYEKALQTRREVEPLKPLAT